jgi:hypothetical protein
MNLQILNNIYTIISANLENIIVIENRRFLKKLFVGFLIFCFTIVPMIYNLTFRNLPNEFYLLGNFLILLSLYLLCRLMVMIENFDNDIALKNMLYNIVIMIVNFLRDNNNNEINEQLRNLNINNVMRMDNNFQNIIRNLIDRNLRNNPNIPNNPENIRNPNNNTNNTNNIPNLNPTTNFNNFHLWINVILPVINGNIYSTYTYNTNRPVDSISQEEITEEYAYTLDECSTSFISEATLNRIYGPNRVIFTIRNPFTNLPLQRIVKWRIGA